jgi:hypothetical protein
LSKFARLLKEVKEKEEASGERPRGKSRREDYVAMKVYISKELHRRLKLKAVEEEKELSELVEEALRKLLGVRVVIEARPKGDTKVGKPDLGVKHQGLLVGFVELKAPGKGADPERYRGHDREQWERFRQLPNLVYTDGRDFALFREGGRSERCDWPRRATPKLCGSSSWTSSTGGP